MTVYLKYTYTTYLFVREEKGLGFMCLYIHSVTLRIHSFIQRWGGRGRGRGESIHSFIHSFILWVSASAAAPPDVAGGFGGVPEVDEVPRVLLLQQLVDGFLQLTRVMEQPIEREGESAQ